MRPRYNMIGAENPISDQFESSFLSMPLAQQIAHCDHYELVDTFKKWLPAHTPILEAGCGSGRWVAWFIKQGWRATGLDWSTELCERAQREIPDGRFMQGDMRHMPFTDGDFGAIVSLGAIEHTPEGPMGSLREYHRVLRPGGIAIITVPYLGPVRRVMRVLRILAKLPLAVFRPYFAEYLRCQFKRAQPWAADFCPDGQGRWNFFQYNFTRQEMRQFLKDSNFSILEENVDFGDEGLLHNFGRLVGVYDVCSAQVQFNIFGKMLGKVLPVAWRGHMLCYVVGKSAV